MCIHEYPRIYVYTHIDPAHMNPMYNSYGGRLSHIGDPEDCGSDSDSPPEPKTQRKQEQQ